ncbi:hypothetical protein C8A01DRAFT_35882 [Parachaetomium inaequale]|uniref:DUF7735 domain-containing protein n=1 Tax=Parachaetomium inaequale TaxID=2588326 RepID=A0AAN6SS46_9PEZI|nr:hypothetical protein C8A01DRAFT_35882 [Parachaetomium inaequale]
MRFNVFLGGLAALTAAAGVSARYLADSPAATITPDPLLAARQATPTTTMSVSRSTLTPDPWQCITENITQYFDVPKPTGNVFDAIASYNNEVNKECLATAVGYEKRSCTMSSPTSWCGFTTAAPADVLSSYSTYVSGVVSFWTAKSATMSILSTSCAVAWGRFHEADHEWVRIATAHADCYLAAHPQTRTGTEGPTATASATTTTSQANVVRRGPAAEAIALVSAGLAALANAA